MSKVFVRTLALVVMGVCLGALATLLLREWLSPAPDVQTEESGWVEIPSVVEVAVRPESDAISKYEAMMARLRGELEESKLQMAEMEAELKRLQDELAAMTALNAASETDGPLDRERKAQALLRQTLRRKDLAGNAMFGALEDIMSMLTKISRLGDAGVAALLDMAADENLALEDRESAFELLVYLPDINALHLALYPPEDLAIELDYSSEDFVEELARMAEWIEPSELAPYREELHRLALDSLEQGSANEALRMIGVLALVHDHPASQQLLQKPSWRRDYADFLLKMAHWVGNDPARTFIEGIAQTHPNADTRGRATEILAGW